MQQIWLHTIGSVTTGVGTAIAAAAGATLAVGSIVVGAVALVVTAYVATFYAMWAPADLLIDDSISLTLLDLATLTDLTSPLPVETIAITNREILKIVTPLSKAGFTYDELRAYAAPAPEGGGAYEITFKYSR
ncbi:hypothetical protein ACN6MT_06310 [Neobacillus niacini]|uniref:hypothetical protein n=1 Tax=Neobacillus niacini TaxID=86668 RepID=UPI003B01C987